MIEKLLKIVKEIESLYRGIDILKSNIRTYPSYCVDLIDKDRRSISRKSEEIYQLEIKMTEISQSLIP